MDTKELSSIINNVFTDAFGRTPLKQRLEDIFKESIELSRYSDLKNMKEEAGDLLCSLLQLMNECSWEAEDCAMATVNKIQHRIKQYKSLGRKTNVCLLGGAFSPVTVGHIQAAQFILDSSKTFDEVWLTPCYNHMYNKKMESSEHRLEMCRLASESDGRIKIFDYEIKNQLAGQTFHFVKKLLDEDFAKHTFDFSIAIGLDNANSFDKWVEYELLEKLIRFVVVPRKGVAFDPKATWFLKEPHIYLAADNPIAEISSTQIRKWLLENNIEKLKENLDHKVLKYILSNNLYK
jgi:nicotinate-nucleotide adenylyltransferase